MVEIRVDPARLVGDGDDLFAIARSLQNAVDRAGDSLSGFGGMAGNDNIGEEIAGGYDASAQDLLDYAQTVANLIRGFEPAIAATAKAYQDAEAVGAGGPASGIVVPSVDSQRAAHIPQALGGGWEGNFGGIDLGAAQEWIEDALTAVGFVYPNANTDQLTAASAAWSDLGDAVIAAKSQLGSSFSAAAGMDLPQWATMQDVRTRLQSLLGDSTTNFTGLVDFLDKSVETIAKLREDFAWMIGQLVLELAVDIGLTVLLGALTAGVGAGAGAVKIMITIGRWVDRILEAVLRAKLAVAAVREALQGALTGALSSGLSTAVISGLRGQFDIGNVVVASTSSAVGGLAGGPFSAVAGGTSRSVIRQTLAGGLSGAADGLASSGIEANMTGTAWNWQAGLAMGTVMGSGGGGIGTGIGNRITPRTTPTSTGGDGPSGPNAGDLPAFDGGSTPAAPGQGSGTPAAPAASAPQAPATAPSPAAAGGGAAAAPAAGGATPSTDANAPQPGTGGGGQGASAPAGGAVPGTDSNAPQPGAGGDAPSQAAGSGAPEAPTAPAGGDTPTAPAADAPAAPASSDAPSAPAADAPASPAADSPAANGTTPDGTTPDATTSHGSTPDGSTPDGSTPDGSTPDGSKPDGSSPDGSSPDGATPDGSTPDGSSPDGATPDGSSPDGSTPDGSAPDGATPDGSSPDGSSPDGATADGATPDGSTPDGTTPQAPALGDVPTVDAPAAAGGSPDAPLADGAGSDGAAPDASALVPDVELPNLPDALPVDAPASTPDGTAPAAAGGTTGTGAVAAGVTGAKAPDAGALSPDDLAPVDAAATADAPAADGDAPTSPVAHAPASEAPNGADAPDGEAPTGADAPGGEAPTGDAGDSANGLLDGELSPEEALAAAGGSAALAVAGTGSRLPNLFAGQGSGADSAPPARTEVTDADSVQSREDVGEWLADVNPDFDGDPYAAASNNCGACTVSVFDRFSGRGDSVADMETRSLAEMAAHVGSPQQAMTPSEIASALEAAGAGSHAVVGVDRAEGPGHWFNAYFDGSEVVAVDGQSNQILDWPPDYGDVVHWDASIFEPANQPDAPARPGAVDTTQPASDQGTSRAALDAKIKAYLRVRTPDQAIRDMVNPEGGGGPRVDPVYGYDVDRYEADHIVPFASIVEMDGFDQLSRSDQIRVINAPENFMGLGKPTNASKGAHTWTSWPGHRVLGPVPESVRAEMLAREADARAALTSLIDRLLGD